MHCTCARGIVDPVLFPPEQIAHDEPTCAALTTSCADCASNERCGWCGASDGTGGCHAVTGSPKERAPAPSVCSASWYPRRLDCPIAGGVRPPDASGLPPATP
jgi:hypothetical protein